MAEEIRAGKMARETGILIVILYNDIKHNDMEAEKVYQEKTARTLQQKQEGSGTLQFVDNRPQNQALQRLGENDDETLQGKFEHPIQREEDDEEALQGKFEQPIQREEDDDEALQGKFDAPVQKKNETGMPDHLKAGIEDLSGFSMDDVRVHYNSDKPLHAGHGHPRGTGAGAAPPARGMARGAADGRACGAYHRGGRHAGERQRGLGTRGGRDGRTGEQSLK